MVDVIKFGCEKEVILPQDVRWACPSCGERYGYLTTFVIQTDRKGMPIRVILKGECGVCGEKKDPPVPYRDPIHTLF